MLLYIIRKPRRFLITVNCKKNTNVLNAKNRSWIRPDPDLDLNYPDLIFHELSGSDPDNSDPDSITSSIFKIFAFVDPQ